MRQPTPELAQSFAENGYTPIWADQIKDGYEIAVLAGSYLEPGLVDYVTVFDLRTSVDHRTDGSLMGGVIPNSAYTNVYFFGEFADGTTKPYLLTDRVPVWVKAA